MWSLTAYSADLLDCLRFRQLPGLLAATVRRPACAGIAFPALYSRHPFPAFAASETEERGVAMNFSGPNIQRAILNLAMVSTLASALPAALSAQDSQGPQTDAPPPVAQPAAAPRVPGRMLTVPSGTRLAVVLENSISTRSANAGASPYF